MRRWDAVVVGAGPAGAATALLLARAGCAVLLLERARFPRDKPCSEYLSPETTRILERLGADVLNEIERAEHAKLYGMKVVAPDGTVMQGRFAANHGYPSPRPYGFALPRTTFDTILRAAAERAGAVVREQTAVEDLLYDRGAVGGVVARSGNGKRDTCRARVVVGADGLRSVVARRLGLRRSSMPRRLALSAHVADVAGVEEMGEMHIGETGYVGLGPIGGGVTTLALVVPLRAVRANGGGEAGGAGGGTSAVTSSRSSTASRACAGARLPIGWFGRCSSPARSPSGRGGWWWTAPCSWATPPISSTRSPARASTAPCAARSLRSRRSPRRSRARRGGGPVTRASLASYVRARRAAFAGKWVLERLIGLGVGWPTLANRVVGRLARRPLLADLLVGATGNFVPAGEVLAPGVLARLLW